jgi:hypothetical protein
MKTENRNVEKEKAAANSRFKKWRKMCKIHIFLPQEFLS